MNFIQPISLRCSNKTNIVHNSCCNIQATGPHTHAPSPKAARDNLLSLLPSRSQAATAPSPLHIIAAVDDLLKHEQPFPKEEASQWHTRLHGRWDLRFTTEAPLARLLSGAARPILSNGIAYQLVSAQSLQNRVEFPVEHNTLPAVLSVGVNYHPSDIEPRCDYAFKNTNILLGRAAARAMHDTEETRGRWPFVNVNWRFGFAVGKGFFRVVWLDHALRIDHDTSKGKDWLNVYVYGGPVEKCQAYRTP